MDIRVVPKQAKKVGNWLLKKPEEQLKKFLLPFVPKWMETYHLTSMTLVWMVVAIVGGYLATNNLNYLWLVSIAIIGQYITDLLDGAVGRERNTGLVKWGFYFDHILDFGFLCSILIGYWLVIDTNSQYIIFATLILSAAYFVHTILYFGATGDFEISSLGIGPTEMRLVLVVVNTMLAVFDKVIFLNFLRLYFLANAIFLIISIYRTQKKLWEIDMSNRLG